MQIKSTTAPSLPRELSTLLEGLKGSAIIYVLTKNEADRLALEVIPLRALTLEIMPWFSLFDYV